MKLDDPQIITSQALVVTIFKSFREELLTVFGNVEHTRKSDASPVTIYDVKVEELLKQELLKAFPEMGFEGEETGSSGNKETYWLVDPIDGTSSFIRGLPFSTNMAALVHEGEVVAAVVYDFLNDHLYTALRGKGAYKNGEKIQVNTNREQGDLFIYSMTRTSFGHIQEALGTLRMRTMLPVGASGHEYMMLAEGKIDGIVNLNRGKGLHDNAPGVMICEEAGAMLLPYDDEKGVYRSQFIIGTPLVTELIEHSGLI
ncbi:inositol monophosphatase [Candidatus Saccharibacteria bacterium]|nr:inositol monophosphatase [Candidatus Saccharibacteria bacterium]